MQPGAELRSPVTGEYPDDIRTAYTRVMEASRAGDAASLIETVDVLVDVVAGHASGQVWVANRDLLPEHPEDYRWKQRSKKVVGGLLLATQPHMQRIMVASLRSHNDLTLAEAQALCEAHGHDSAAWGAKGALGRVNIYCAFILPDTLGRARLLEGAAELMIGQKVDMYVDLESFQPTTGQETVLPVLTGIAANTF